ncbi:helix-turn-helix transcriptional regulator [Kordiimonas sp. SCSIO 12603]|uniref:winged helix-turn-helix transcriptional regulator n=1 Tax=Kordiimonas sp. SCSIO 12603 TaxID=2829596 RepID=UPI002103E229|nr:helix-turn-helix domain-containing protein [Kordiimonas sp. SCSIO 12603]UTW59199.1 helix-turn-helix transcriptional regulator [Kordiimonas sp. SCSIO 12603]
MTQRNSTEWHGCPIRYGASIFGDNWSMLVLRDLMFKGARHFQDFLNAGEGIATNILTNRLKKLEEEGVVKKLPDPEHGVRKIYQLTDKGLSLVPAMLEIIDWSEKWDNQTEVPQEFSTDLRTDRAALAFKIIEDLKVSYKA